MATPKRISTPGNYFITTATWNQRRLFQVPAAGALLLETLQHYRSQGYYQLHAFVVMPEHLHLLITPNSIPVERAIMLIKGGFSHRLQAALPTWQRGFTDHRIRDRADFIAHYQYIHHNPVRARLCHSPEDYPFSSAHS